MRKCHDASCRYRLVSHYVSYSLELVRSKMKIAIAVTDHLLLHDVVMYMQCKKIIQRCCAQGALI